VLQNITLWQYPQRIFFFKGYICGIGNNEDENLSQAEQIFNIYYNKPHINNSATSLYVFASNSASETVIDSMNKRLVQQAQQINAPYYQRRFIERKFVRKGRMVLKNKGLNDNELCGKLKYYLRWYAKKVIKSQEYMSIKRVNIYNNFALNLLSRYDIEIFKNNKSAKIAMLGFGLYGAEIVKNLCAIGQLPNYKIDIVIYTNNI